MIINSLYLLTIIITQMPGEMPKIDHSWNIVHNGQTSTCQEMGEFVKSTILEEKELQIPPGGQILIRNRCIGENEKNAIMPLPEKKTE